MTSIGKKELFEGIGLVAIVASLVFVGFQLRQDRIIARAELTSESFQFISAIQEDLTSNDIARVFAKMLEQPENLTLEEKIQIDNLFRRVTAAYRRECYLMSRGVLAECEEIIQATAWQFFGNAYGQSWYRLNGPKGDDDSEFFPFPKWIETEIEGFDPNTYRRAVEDMIEAN